MDRPLAPLPAHELHLFTLDGPTASRNTGCHTAMGNAFGPLHMESLQAPSIPVQDLVFSPVTFGDLGVAEYLTQDEVNAFYQTIHFQLCGSCPVTWPNGPRGFLYLYDKLILRNAGNFPIPGWYAYMIASRFLERCDYEFKRMAGYDEWFKAVMIPRVGVFNHTPVVENTKKALLEEHMIPLEPKKRLKKSVHGRPTKTVRAPRSLACSMIVEKDEPMDTL